MVTPRAMFRRDTASPQRSRRSWWIRQIRSWHWVSAAVSLVAILFFAATGITLNHADSIPATPAITEHHGQLSPAEQRLLASGRGDAPLPLAVVAAIKAATGLDTTGLPAEWSDDEAYVALPRPGGDAWVSIERDSGAILAEVTDRGWVAWANDLHKGRNSSRLWLWFIDVFAVACIVFTLSGLLLLYVHSSYRRFTWPIVIAGLLLPLLLALH